jgi:hypothetical protein
VSAHFTLLAAVLLCLLGFAVGVFGTLVGVRRIHPHPVARSENSAALLWQLHRG